MKLIIQIPCHNEETNLPATLRDLPRKIDGIDKIETLVIDDGSVDDTAAVARHLGADHVLGLKSHKGLACAFSEGIDRSLRLGADIIVNTDGDNQYAGADIPLLVKPILDGSADFVIGARQLDGIAHFSWLKRKLLRLGSAIVGFLSQTDVPDAVSGFRAFSREAALRMNILTTYSYTIENLVQLGNQRLRILSVPVRTNPKARPSRLIKNVPHFLGQQVATILRVYATYKALKVFLTLGLIILLPGLFGFLRFLYFYLTGRGQGHIQSLIVSAAAIFVGFLMLMFGVIADLIGNNRKLVESALYRIRRLELEKAERTRDED